ncbi:MAG: potassium/proton antiporter [Chitinophagales bacterium]|nr:potassium/proton antiporter [Chitinophagales bacterium]
MNLTIENILLIGSILLFISIIAGKTSSRFGVPTLIFFLAVGMLAGSEGIGGIHFDNPKIAQFIGIVSLNFILFSGGLETNWRSIKPILKQGIVLSTLGVLLTASLIGLFVFWVTDFTIYESLLLGSIVSSTDAAAVFSILRSRSIALRSNLRPTLELESGSNDPMAYVLTIIFLTLVVNQDENVVTMIPIFFKQMFLGAMLGLAFGKLSKLIVNRIQITFDGLYPILVIALMFITFSATDFVGGNGFLAIYLAAVYFGNQDVIHKKNIINMYDGLAWLMQIVLFLTLGLQVFPSKILPVLGIGILISFFLIVFARPISVLLCLLPFKMEMNRRLFISWVGLRGAVPIVFATYPLLAGIDKANMIFNIVFFISLTSVLIQGTTISTVAKWLKVAIPEAEKELDDTDKLLLNLPKSLLREFEVCETCRAVNKKIVDLNLPKNTFIVMIKRGDKFLRPGGSTQIFAKDKLVVLADNQDDFTRINECFSKARTT